MVIIKVQWLKPRDRKLVLDFVAAFHAGVCAVDRVDVLVASERPPGFLVQLQLRDVTAAVSLTVVPSQPWFSWFVTARPRRHTSHRVNSDGNLRPFLHRTVQSMREEVVRLLDLSYQGVFSLEVGDGEG